MFISHIILLLDHLFLFTSLKISYYFLNALLINFKTIIITISLNYLFFIVKSYYIKHFLKIIFITFLFMLLKLKILIKGW